MTFAVSRIQCRKKISDLEIQDQGQFCSLHFVDVEFICGSHGQIFLPTLYARIRAQASLVSFSKVTQSNAEAWHRFAVYDSLRFNPRFECSLRRSADIKKVAIRGGVLGNAHWNSMSPGRLLEPAGPFLPFHIDLVRCRFFERRAKTSPLPP